MLPLLARALAARAGVRAAPAPDADDLLARLTTAVRSMDEADRAYRSAIEAALPAAAAREVLRALASFRADVADLRERTRAATGYGDFDPLDTYVPSIDASHAHAVRAANVADLARGDVAERRARSNAQVGALLERHQIERLIEAKRLRNAAFDRAIRRAVTGASDGLATELMLLADGWY